MGNKNTNVAPAKHVVGGNVIKRDRLHRDLSRAQLAMDLGADAIFWIESDGGFVDANPAACRSLGYSLDELLSMGVPDIDINFDAAHWPEHWLHLKEHGSLKLETVHRRKDGRLFPVEVSANYLVLDDREFNCAFVRDITERREAEDALRESEHRFRTLVESTRVVAWERDLHSRHFTYVSPQAEVLLGYPLEKWGADNFWNDHVHPDDREEAARVIATTALTGRDHELEYRMLKADGTPIWLHGIITVRRDEAGTPMSLSCFLIDIDERVRAQEDLERSNEELMQFAYVASHDLQEPLDMVAGFSELLADRYRDQLDVEGEEYIGYVVEGVRRTKELITDLLEFARVGSQGHTFTTADLGGLLNEALAVVRPALRDVGGAVSHDLLPTLRVDARQ